MENKTIEELKSAVASEMGEVVISAVQTALQHSGLVTVARLWKVGFRTRIYLGDCFVEITDGLKMIVKDSGELTEKLQAVVDKAEATTMNTIIEAVLGNHAEMLREAQASYKHARQARAASSDEAERAELREKMSSLHARCQLLVAVKAAAHRLDPEIVNAARAERATMDEL